MFTFKKSISILLIFLAAGCAHAGLTQSSISKLAVGDIGEDGYPNIWWQAIPDDQVAGWEIPPQAADRAKGEVVLSKRNELGQFSNLGASSFVLDGDAYASVEGLWQGMKYPESDTDERLKDSAIVWPFTRAQVMAMSGFDAKKAGDLANQNMKKLGIKWITYKGEKLEYNGADSEKHYQLILRACRAKLAQNPQLLKLLLSTGRLVFLADHKQAPDSLPAYKYNEIYFKLREEIQNK